MKAEQFSLAGIMIAVAICALGLVVVRWVDHTATGYVWAPLVGIYYFGGFLAFVLRARRRTVRACRYAVVGLLVGIVPGCVFGAIEDLSSAQPSDAVGLGSIICTGLLGTLVGFVLGYSQSHTTGPGI